MLRCCTMAGDGATWPLKRVTRRVDCLPSVNRRSGSTPRTAQRRFTNSSDP